MVVLGGARLTSNAQTSKLVPPADARDATGYVIPSVHGHGPIEVSVPGHPLPLDKLVFSAARELGGRWQFKEDLNDGVSLGTGKHYKVNSKAL